MKTIFFAVVLMLFCFNVHTQTYIETMGNVSGTTLIPAHTGWTYNNVLNYSGSGDVRNTSPSSGYTQASGGANVFLTNTVGKDFIISGINTETFLNLNKISFGVLKSTIASNGSELILEYSTNMGSTWTQITKPAFPTGSGTGVWRYVSTDTVTFPTVTNLSIRFRQNGTGTLTFRIDDVTLVGDGALPVTMTSFTHSLIENNLGLFWTTSMEINNAGFDIERKALDKTWIKIGNVPGVGNSTTAQSYSYYDNKLDLGSYLYRLRQIDFNGHSEYFDLNQTVNVAAPKNYSLHQNFPNPCNPETTFEYQLPEISRVRLEIFDIIGRSVAVLIDTEQGPGYHKAHFKADKLASGIYFYTLSAGTFTQIKKMIVLK